MQLKKGQVSKVIGDKVIVVFDEDDLLSDELLLLNVEYNPPKVDASVICLIPDQGEGLCLNGYLSADEIPADKVYQKQLSDQNVISVDNLGNLLITAPNIKVIGDVEVTGDISVIGTITSTGQITAGGVVLS